jgi:DNA-binding XRE family transcriptional regulator
MGKRDSVRVLTPRWRPLPFELPRLPRRRPRSFEEWAALRRWRRLPAEEQLVPGYLLRAAREEGGLTQQDLARRLGCSQQAVSQAERWSANPTAELMRAWAEATGRRLEIELVPRRSRR